MKIQFSSSTQQPVRAIPLRIESPTKRAKLCEIECFDDENALLVAAISDRVCPAICYNPENPNCASMAEMEPDQDRGWCEMREGANAGVRARPHPGLPPTGNASCPYQYPIAPHPPAVQPSRDRASGITSRSSVVAMGRRRISATPKNASRSRHVADARSGHPFPSERCIRLEHRIFAVLTCCCYRGIGIAWRSANERSWRDC